jgi:hypothetical protein
MKEYGPCTHCGGLVGPDFMGGPMCYGCGHIDKAPDAIRALWEIATRAGPGHWSCPIIDRVIGSGASRRWWDENHARLSGGDS